MKIYFDGASISEITEVLKLGIISGITTNLSFCKKEMMVNKKDYLEILTDIKNTIEANKKKISFSIQVSKNNYNDVILEAEHFKKNFNSSNYDLKIKVPLNYENFKAINQLIKKEIKVNATCVTSLMQGVAAANLGCSYVSFFWGKMTDEDIDPKKIIYDFKNLLIKNGLDKTTKILVGSIRQPQVVSEAFVCGADIVTMQFLNFKKILNQLKSDEANLLFQADWNR